MAMEPNEIFELIVSADEKLKYATAAQSDARRRRQARGPAHAGARRRRGIGNDALVQQAELRFKDPGEWSRSPAGRAPRPPGCRSRASTETWTSPPARGAGRGRSVRRRCTARRG